MLPRSWSLASVILLALAAPAFAQEAVKLAWMFEKDKPIYQEMTTETKQTMKVMEMLIPMTQKTTFFWKWTPKEQDKDKNWVLALKAEVVRIEMEIGGAKTSFDSTKNQNANDPRFDLFNALVGAELTFTISPAMDVLKIEGRDKVVNKLLQPNPPMKPLAVQIASEEAFKQMVEHALIPLPDKPVKKGDTWKKESKLSMGPIGSYDSVYTYTYAGKDDNLDKIKVDATLKYSLPSKNTADGLPFTIQSANLRTEKASGTILFDNVKHRLGRSESNVSLEGRVAIEIGGRVIEVDLTQTQTTTVKLTDKQ